MQGVYRRADHCKLRYAQLQVRYQGGAKGSVRSVCSCLVADQQQHHTALSRPAAPPLMMYLRARHEMTQHLYRTAPRGATRSCCAHEPALPTGLVAPTPPTPPPVPGPPAQIIHQAEVDNLGPEETQALLQQNPNPPLQQTLIFNKAQVRPGSSRVCMDRIGLYGRLHMRPGPGRFVHSVRSTRVDRQACQLL